MKSTKLGKKIKHYREENKLTQQELADKIGVTWEMVSRYERGLNEPYNRLNALTKALNVDLAELLQNNDNTNTVFQIPLFTKIPENFYFENTTYYYTCPLWIQNIDKKVFAIDMNLVNENKGGIYYISPRTKPKNNSFVFLKENQIFKIERFENQKNIIGVALAKEVKLL